MSEVIDEEFNVLSESGLVLYKEGTSDKDNLRLWGGGITSPDTPPEV